jgi:hypothetical protein
MSDGLLLGLRHGAMGNLTARDATRTSMAPLLMAILV